MINRFFPHILPSPKGQKLVIHEFREIQRKLKYVTRLYLHHQDLLQACDTIGSESKESLIRHLKEEKETLRMLLKRRVVLRAMLIH